MRIFELTLYLMLSFSQILAQKSINQLVADDVTPTPSDARTGKSNGSLVGVTYTCFEPSRSFLPAEYYACRLAVDSFVRMYAGDFWRLTRHKTDRGGRQLHCPFSYTEMGCKLSIDYVDVWLHPATLIMSYAEQLGQRLARGCTPRRQAQVFKWGGYVTIEQPHGEDIVITLENALNPQELGTDVKNQSDSVNPPTLEN